jgi:hypothetical protein
MGLTRLRAEQISDIDYKQAVRVITVTDVTNLSGGAPNQVDGVNLTVGDRILVTAQDPGSENGIYQVQTVGTGSNGTWIRSLDTNATGELEAGTIVMVTEGTTYADTQWKLTTNNPIIIGTTPLTFVQNSADAFGNIYANGTAILANTVGSVLTLTPGNNIEITGNNTTKTVTIGVTGISLNSISNGTSNVNVVSSGGNVTVGVGGTANVAEFSTGGLKITGFTSATGNVIGGNILTAGLMSATSTITSAANIIGGNITTAGLITATGNIQAGNVRTAGLITATGNITGGNLSIVGDATISGNLSVTGNATLSGNILGDRIINGNTSIEIQTPSGNANVSVGGISNVAVFTTTGLNITGLVSASGNVIGGNILTVGQISATGNVTGNFFVGNGAFLTGLSAGTSNAIANGATRIDIPVSSGNIAMSVAGQANTVVISLGTFSMYGTFATPKLLQANVQIAPDTNAVLFGPVEVDPAYNISVPDDSTLYIIGSL